MISIKGDEAGSASGVYKVELKDPASATNTGGTYNLTERTDVPGEYFAVPTSSTVAGTYRIVITKNNTYYATGPDLYYWDGTKAVTADNPSITTLLNRASESRLAKLDDLGTSLNGAIFIEPVPTLKTRFITKNGSGTNSGKSPKNAWSLTQFLTAINDQSYADGTTFLLKGGETYEVNQTISLGAGTNQTAHLGSYGGKRATIKITNDSSHGILFYNTNGSCRNINVIGNPTNTTKEGIFAYGDIANANYNILIRNCNTEYFYNGIVIGSFGFDNIKYTATVSQCEVRYCTEIAIHTYSNSINNRLSNFTIEGCYVEPLTGNGIVVSGCSNSVIRNCTASGVSSTEALSAGDNLIWLWRALDSAIRDCKAHYSFGNAADTDAGCIGIDIETERCIIERCYCHDSQGQGILVMGGADHIVRNNVVVNCGTAPIFGVSTSILIYGEITSSNLTPVTNLSLYNNTIVLGPDSLPESVGILSFVTANTGKIMNNIIYSSINRTLVDIKNTSLEFYGNVYWSPAGIKLKRGTTTYTSLTTFRTNKNEVLNSTDVGSEANPGFLDTTFSNREVNSFSIATTNTIFGVDLLANTLVTTYGTDYQFNNYPASGTKPRAGALQPNTTKPTLSFSKDIGQINYSYVVSDLRNSIQLESGFYKEVSNGLYAAVFSVATGRYLVRNFKDNYAIGSNVIQVKNNMINTDIGFSSNQLDALYALLNTAKTAYTTAALASAPVNNNFGNTQATQLNNLSATLSGAGVFSTASLVNAPTGGGGSFGTTQVTQLNDLAATLASSGVFSSAALTNAPAGGGGGSGLTTEQNTHLLAIPTDNDLSAITSAINSARDTVITNIGSVPNDVETVLSTQLDLIQSEVTIARQESVNNYDIDDTTHQAVLYADDNTTELYRYQLKDKDGNPSSTGVYSREKIATQ